MNTADKDLFKEIKEIESLARTLLEIAEKDCLASRVLYREGLFPQSVFMAEQCAEKAAKALYLQEATSNLSGDVNKILNIINQIKTKIKYEIKHSAAKLVIIMMEEYCNKIASIRESLKAYNIEVFKQYAPQLIEELSLVERISECEEILSSLSDKNKIKVMVKEIEKEQEDISKSGRVRDLIEEIQKYFYDTEEYCKNLENLIEEFQNKFNEILNNRKIHELKALLNAISGKNVNFDEALKALYQNIPAILRVVGGALYKLSAFLTIIKLYLLLFPHVTKTRYPDTYNPLAIYTLDMPLVKELDKILTLLEKSIIITKNENLDELCSHNL